jgi:hypothetical protein
MTTGRSGSTSLMQALEAYDDIALPNRQIDCADNELLRPEGLDDHLRAYEALTGRRLDGGPALIEAFYDYSRGAAFAGFKSMPRRHDDFDAFVARPDIQFITLVRADVPSTIASFMLAGRKGTWRRYGRVPAERWVFRPAEDGPVVRALLAGLQNNLRKLARVPNAIRLSYEDLCTPGYVSPALERFFGRPVRLADPQPPVSGARYTGNWEGFLEALGPAAEPGRRPSGR